MTLVLASASPRRRELLSNAGLQVSVRPANVPEVRGSGEAPIDYVRRLARQKATAIAPASGEIVLGADTTVEIDGEALEKPADPADAARMLRQLQGRTHLVHTGICLATQGHQIVDLATTAVTMTPISEEEIQEYIATGQPADKAGAYGIQGFASRYIERIDGCYFNVVGLPISLVWRHLKRLSAGG